MEEEAAMKEAALLDALHGNLYDMDETKLREGNLYVVLFKIQEYDKVLSRYAKEKGSILSNTIRNIIGGIFSKEKEIEISCLMSRRASC